MDLLLLLFAVAPSEETVEQTSLVVLNVVNSFFDAILRCVDRSANCVDDILNHFPQILSDLSLFSQKVVQSFFNGLFDSITHGPLSLDDVGC